MHPILSAFAGFAVFKIPKFGLEIGLLIFQTSIPILGQTCRNSRGHVIAQKNLKLGVFSSYVQPQNRKYKKIFEKKSQKKREKKKKRVAHKQKRQCSVHLCDYFAPSLHLDTCTSFLVPWSNCSITFSRPTTRTSTWNTYSALLSVTDFCATYIYLVSLPRTPAFSRSEQVLLCNHTHAHWTVTPVTVCHLQCW